MRKIKKSSRGLTFSLNDTSLIGKKFSYLVSNAGKSIQIFLVDTGDHTISRKKSGEEYKALIDLRSAEVREVISTADYMGIEELEDRVVVHVFKKVEPAHYADTSKLYSIGDVLCEKTAEIVIPKAEEYLALLREYEKQHQNSLHEESVLYCIASLFS